MGLMICSVTLSFLMVFTASALLILLKLLLKAEHTLKALLFLEAANIMIFLMMSHNFTFLMHENTLFIIFLVMMVCEAALGVSILVRSSREFNSSSLVLTF